MQHTTAVILGLYLVVLKLKAYVPSSTPFTKVSVRVKIRALIGNG